MLGADERSNAPGLVDGVFDAEHDGVRAFRWTSDQFRIARSMPERYLELELGTPRDGTITLGGQALTLSSGWHYYSFDCQALQATDLGLSVAPALNPPGDSRTLGVMLGKLRWHDDDGRHSTILRRRQNEIDNEIEYRSGATVLNSVPPWLRISMEMRCNIANEQACVYCSWNWAKTEEAGAPAFDADFLDQLSDYFSLATDVTDCSYGEPPLHREFPEIVDRIASTDRLFSFVSNGQTLGNKVRNAMLGRNVLLSVSMDAPTAAGYARYRDQRFDLIINNLRALCQEKQATGNLPMVKVGFIVMQSNKDEVADFLRLMKSVGVDRVSLRALYVEDCMDLDGDVQQRGTFTFDYSNELVSLAELTSIGHAAQQLSTEIGLSLVVEWSEFSDNQVVALADQKAPLCSEPWKSAYALNRGIMPCCYGRKPVARWTEQGDRSVRQFLDDTLNGPEFQALRRDLAAGILPKMCMETTSCPIVRRELST